MLMGKKSTCRSPSASEAGAEVGGQDQQHGRIAPLDPRILRIRRPLPPKVERQLLHRFSKQLRVSVCRERRQEKKERQLLASTREEGGPMAHLLQLGPLVPPAESCGHASTTDRGDAPRSAMFAVKSVGTTPAAVLLQRQPLARVRFALHCHVVATFTFVAGHRDGRSFVTWHLALSLHSFAVPST